MHGAQVPRSAVRMLGPQGKALKKPVADSRARVAIHRREMRLKRYKPLARPAPFRIPRVSWKK